MLKEMNYKTITYEITDKKYDGFMIDVVEKNDAYEIYIYHRNYGIKSLMFGLLKSLQSENTLLKNIEMHVFDYAKKYMDKYMD